MMRPNWPTMTVKEVAERVGGKVDGDAAIKISGVSLLGEARAGDLVYIGNENHLRLWEESPAVAALVAVRIGKKVRRRAGVALVLVNNVDVALAKLLEMVEPLPPVAGLEARKPGGATIHPTAVVDATARLGERVSVGAFCVIGPDVYVGDGTTIYSGVTLHDRVEIGLDCVLWNGVVVREGCVVGDRCVLNSHVVIGTEGFGFRPTPDGESIYRIPHLGNVVLGNDVECGANTCIDRGKLSATTIGDFTKIDNLCQIGHDCRLGRGVIIAGNVGISGAVTIGDGVLIGGGAGVADHVTIGAGAQIAAASGVMRDVPAGLKVCGTPARHALQFFREQSALSKLPDTLRPQRPRFGEGTPPVAPP